MSRSFSTAVTPGPVSGPRSKTGWLSGVRLPKYADRPAESYLAFPAVAGAPARSSANWLNADTRYILLAACRSDQSAKEVRVGEDATRSNVSGTGRGTVPHER